MTADQAKDVAAGDVRDALEKIAAEYGTKRSGDPEPTIFTFSISKMPIYFVQVSPTTGPIADDGRTDHFWFVFDSNITNDVEGKPTVMGYCESTKAAPASIACHHENPKSLFASQ